VPLVSLGELSLEQGRAREAAALLEEGIQICTRNECDPLLVPSLFFGQAKALSAEKRDPRRALELAKRAKQLLEKQDPKDPKLAKEIDTWLTGHGG